MAVPLNPREEMEFILGRIEEKEFILGRVISGVMAFDGEVVPGCKVTKEVKKKSEVQQVVDTSSNESSFEEAMSDLAQIEIEGEDERSSLKVDEDIGDHGSMVEAERYDEASVLDEVGGDLLEGGAGLENDLVMDGIKGDRPRLIDEVAKDESLRVARELGKRQAEGYSYENGILVRARLDRLGHNKVQICLPATLRGECLRLAHSKFDRYIKQCEQCQRHDKTKPPLSPMQPREVVTVPFERVCIDLVGPFPTAKGGFKFLLTCVDMATRWPEAVPIRVCTARVIIDKLTDIFAHNGFPKTIVSDNEDFGNDSSKNL